MNNFKSITIQQFMAFKWIEKNFCLEKMTISILSFDTLFLNDGINSARIQFKSNQIYITFDSNEVKCFPFSSNDI